MRVLHQQPLFKLRASPSLKRTTPLSHRSMASSSQTMHRQKFTTDPVANPSAIVGGGKNQYRFTVLTDGLVRYEWAEDSQFEDRASTFAIRRNLPKPDFRVKDTESSLEIITKRFHLFFNKEPFSPRGLSVTVKGAFSCHASIWRYGEEGGELGVQGSGDMGGTARTLDESNGPIPLGPGVVSSIFLNLSCRD